MIDALKSIGMTLYALVGAFVILVSMVSWATGWAIRRKLRKHQREWDEIKKEIPDNEIFDRYMEYLKQLREREGHTFLGPCFPRM